MQYNGKNEILIWAVLSEPMVKFHNFASLGSYFLMFQPQKTKKIQKKLVRQFLILADFGHIVNRPNFMVFYPNDPKNCPQIWLTRYQKLRMDLPSSKICLESTYHKYRPQAWSIWELAHLPKSPFKYQFQNSNFIKTTRIYFRYHHYFHLEFASERKMSLINRFCKNY